MVQRRNTEYSELRYPYEGSKTLMHVFDSLDDKSLILELLNGMYAELPEKKPKKAGATYQNDSVVAKTKNGISEDVVNDWIEGERSKLKVGS